MRTSIPRERANRRAVCADDDPLTRRVVAETSDDWTEENDRDDADDDEIPAQFDPRRWDDYLADFDDEEPDPEPGDFWPEPDVDEAL